MGKRNNAARKLANVDDREFRISRIVPYSASRRDASKIAHPFIGRYARPDTPESRKGG
jgi:hypothetical protein